MTSHLNKSNGPQAEACKKLLKSVVVVIKARASTLAEMICNITSFKKTRALFSCKSVLELKIIPEDDPNWGEK